MFLCLGCTLAAHIIASSALQRFWARCEKRRRHCAGLLRDQLPGRRRWTQWMDSSDG